MPIAATIANAHLAYWAPLVVIGEETAAR